MVDLTPWEKQINEMARFYIGLDNVVKHEADKFYAGLAKDSALQIIDLIEKYKADPQNRYLKQIHANIMTLTRGVEGFQDADVDRTHNSYGSLQYDILDYIRKNVRW